MEENKIEICPCESSNVKGYGFSNGTLRVDFGSGVYDYKGVPESVYQELQQAPSKGKFINSLKSQYKASKV